MGKWNLKTHPQGGRFGTIETAAIVLNKRSQRRN